MVLNRSIEDPCILLEPGHLIVTYIDPPLLKKTFFNINLWDKTRKASLHDVEWTTMGWSVEEPTASLWSFFFFSWCSWKTIDLVAVRMLRVLLLRLVLLVILHVHFAMRHINKLPKTSQATFSFEPLRVYICTTLQTGGKSCGWF